MERVMIVGGPGSGKSTLARGLGAFAGLPVFHMDHIHYGPGWQQREPEVKSWMSEEVHRKSRWISGCSSGAPEIAAGRNWSMSLPPRRRISRSCI
ncbi:hypothetical protein [Oceanicola sp. D3]|uniref:hypothetical protein n=1 Tax=Oceanicola sp. D3 TaxID=2587163 RepID=UPI001C2F10BB|nr:hypothetical protein [Oceanicola sp. D3]